MEAHERAAGRCTGEDEVKQDNVMTEGGGVEQPGQAAFVLGVLLGACARLSVQEARS